MSKSRNLFSGGHILIHTMVRSNGYQKIIRNKIDLRVNMIALLYAIVTMSVIYSTFASFVAVSGSEPNSINTSVSPDFGDNLKSKIQNLISDALNDTGNILNSSSFLGNASYTSDSQIVISKNKIISSVNSNNSAEASAGIKSKITTINGVCNSVKVAGNGNDTLYSSGNCNDEFTGGRGADKFTCGQGNDTIKDYNPKEGDIILDRQNCEKVQ